MKSRSPVEIREARNALGWTQVKLSRMAGVATSRTSEAENGHLHTALAQTSPALQSALRRINGALDSPELAEIRAAEKRREGFNPNFQAAQELRDPVAKANGLDRLLRQYRGEEPFDPGDPRADNEGRPEHSSLRAAAELRMR